MDNINPKYSIIIPVRNGNKYLSNCIRSITDQKYHDYEIIVSDDNSTDGTKDFLRTLSHPNIIIVEPSESLSMTEHWEWALTFARGDWLIFVGQDDGLQPYFFQLADKLTEIADSKGLRSITSERAYFFWRGCEFVYGDIAVNYNAVNKVKIHNSKIEALKSLLGFQPYFKLPQMYTTSLLKRNIIDEAKCKQGGKLFKCHPQDANLAAIACSLDCNYLKSYIPLGWVGTSPKSAGMAVSFGSSNEGAQNLSELDLLKNEYEQKVAKSKLQYHPLAGNFAFGDVAIYFWQSLLKTESIRSPIINRCINLRFFKIIIFGVALANLRKQEQCESRSLMLEEIIKNNLCSSRLVYMMSNIILFGAFLWRVPCYFYRVLRRVIQIQMNTQIIYKLRWSEDSAIDMLKASDIVMRLLNEKKWLG